MTDRTAGHYRPDIDGLRAIAVLSVVAFHAFPGIIRSGFVGVDIFFVISGFLITSIILNDIAKDRFSFATFYKRRIKRIFPALLLVLVASLLAGWFLLLPDEYRHLGKHAAAGTGFVSNFALWQEANYFDFSSDTKILLHLWSLGIEEQFYLIWPALIWVAWQLRLNRFVLFSAILVASLAYSIKTTSLSEVTAFYSPAARFWELATGSVLAEMTFSSPRAAAWIERTVSTIIASVLFERNSVDKEKFYRAFLSIVGIGLIASAVFAITRRHEFPGWWALMPVIGTYLTILAGPGALLNRIILSNRIMVWFGLISYPLYLWHWPLLAFARNLYGHTPPLSARCALVGAAVLLARLTYIYVEKPIRFGYRQWWIAPVLCAAIVAAGTFGAVDSYNDGFRWRLTGNKAAYAAYFENYLYDAAKHDSERTEIAQNRCNFYSWDSLWPTNGPRAAIDTECYTRQAQKSVLILGDSNAADLYYGLKQVLPKEISTLLIFSSGCQVRPLNDAHIKEDHCNMANHFALERIKTDPPDVVLMSSNNSFDIDYIRQFAAMVKSYGVKHVLVLGQRPHWKPYLYKIILNEYWSSTPQYIPGNQDDELLALGDRFKAALRADDPFEFVDEKEPFCNSDGCLVYLEGNRREGLITFDDAHLRPFASVWLAQNQLAPLILKRMGE